MSIQCGPGFVTFNIGSQTAGSCEEGSLLPGGDVRQPLAGHLQLEEMGDVAPASLHP